MATEEAVPNLVVVRTCGDNAEASLIRSLLASRGIEAFVQGEHHRSMLGVVAPYIDLRVMVAGAQREDAEEVLAELSSGALDGGADAEALDEPVADGELEGASCAIHHHPANSTCDRCGAFLCVQCGSAEGIICAACEARLASEGTEDERSRRRRWIALGMLFVICGGPVIFVVLYRLLTRG